MEVFCPNICMCTMYVTGNLRGQKRVLDYLELDGCEPPVVCWESNLSPLEEQKLLSHLSSSCF